MLAAMVHGGVILAAKDKICGHMKQRSALLGTGPGQVFNGKGVDLVGQVDVSFSLVNGGVGRGINQYLRLQLLDFCDHGWVVCDVEVCMAKIHNRSCRRTGCRLGRPQALAQLAHAKHQAAARGDWLGWRWLMHNWLMHKPVRL